MSFPLTNIATWYIWIVMDPKLILAQFLVTSAFDLCITKCNQFIVISHLILPPNLNEFPSCILTLSHEQDPYRHTDEQPQIIMPLAAQSGWRHKNHPCRGMMVRSKLLLWWGLIIYVKGFSQHWVTFRGLQWSQEKAQVTDLAVAFRGSSSWSANSSTSLFSSWASSTMKWSRFMRGLLARVSASLASELYLKPEALPAYPPCMQDITYRMCKHGMVQLMLDTYIFCFETKPDLLNQSTWCLLLVTFYIMCTVNGPICHSKVFFS